MRTCVFGAALLALAAGVANAQTSTFDTDAEGWSVVNDVSGFTWTDQIGNPPGAVQANDNVSGVIWFFNAPAAYSGDRSAAFGTAITWDLYGIRGNHTSVSNIADVILIGNGTAIGIDVDAQPVNGQWTSWSAPIMASANWRTVPNLSTGAFAGAALTDAEIQAVLANLTGLRLRGEFTSGADSAALDNVNMVPAPGAIALLAVGGLCIARRRR